MGDETGIGGADEYREFLRSEFFPHIEKHYKANSHRTIIGHSLGGLFALYDMMMPDRLFQSYVAVDPSVTFGDGYLEKRIEQFSDKPLRFNGRLYISVATKGTGPENTDLPDFLKNWEIAQISFFKLLQSKSVANLILKQDVFPSEDHVSVITPSIYAGVRHAFFGYLPLQDQVPSKSKLAWQVFNEIAKDPGLLARHYVEFSESIGAKYAPEQRLVEASGHAAKRLKLYENAETLFQMNTKNFPDSAYTFETLAAFYTEQGKTEKALEAYQRAAELDPENEEYKGRIEALTR